MRNSKPTLALAAIFAVCGLLLASCGGGSGSSSAANRNLPPDPGSAATATLAGVDVNSNGVRDEFENTLSPKIASDEQYATTIKVAKAYQAFLTSKLPTTRAEALILYGQLSCASGSGIAYGQSTNTLKSITFDSAERKEILSKINKLIDGGFDAEELPPCQ
jgi:hypothetical protein